MLRFFSVFAFLLMVVSFVGLFYTESLFSPSPWVIAVQVVGAALFLWARITFGARSFHFAANPTEGGLVTTGPYRTIRHPIYSALCLIVWAGVIAHRSWMAAGLAALLTAGAIVRILCEERLVTERYPEYRDYAKGTWRMVPFVF